MSEDRLTYIGGVAAAVIVTGEHFGITRRKLWETYKGIRVPDPIDPDAPDIRRGRLYEEVALEEYARLTGCEVGRQQHFLRHQDYSFLGGHIDAFAAGRIVEIKCPRPHKWREYKDAGVPTGYLVQGLHYLALCPEAEGLDFAFWEPVEAELLIYSVERPDVDFVADSILDRCVTFWETLALDDYPGDAEPLDLPETSGDVREIEDLAPLMGALADAQDIRKLAESHETSCKRRLLEALPEPGVYASSSGKLHYRRQAGRRTLDKELVRAEFPDIDDPRFYTAGEPSYYTRLYPRKEKR